MRVRAITGDGNLRKARYESSVAGRSRVIRYAAGPAGPAGPAAYRMTRERPATLDSYRAFRRLPSPVIARTRICSSHPVGSGARSPARAAGRGVGYASRWTVSGAKAGTQTEMYSAPSAPGVL